MVDPPYRQAKKSFGLSRSDFSITRKRKPSGCCTWKSRMPDQSLPLIGLRGQHAGRSSPSGSYIFSGWQYGGFLFFAAITVKHLIFKCMDSDDTFDLLIQSVNLGGGLGCSLQIPSSIAAGCNKEDIISNVTGWSVFLNVFPPGIPTKPKLGVGGEISTNPVTGNAPSTIPYGSISPGYGLEVSAGGSYSWIVR